MAGQAEAEGELKGERCPGEEMCQQAGPLARFPDQPIERVCGGCYLRTTKPGYIPRDLAPWIEMALELDALKEGGAVFQYPDALSPWEWATLRALQLGRADARTKEDARRAREAERQANENRLRRLVGQ